MKEKLSNGKISPAQIVKQLKDKVAGHPQAANIEVTPDIHWIFIRSIMHKSDPAVKKHCGKWKYDAQDNESLISRVCDLLPLVANGKLPVIKLTNIGNVFTDERVIVVYCFDDIATPTGTRESLEKNFKGQFYWGSDRFFMSKTK